MPTSDQLTGVALVLGGGYLAARYTGLIGGGSEETPGGGSGSSGGDGSDAEPTVSFPGNGTGRAWLNWYQNQQQQGSNTTPASPGPTPGDTAASDTSDTDPTGTTTPGFTTSGDTSSTEDPTGGGENYDTGSTSPSSGSGDDGLGIPSEEDLQGPSGFYGDAAASTTSTEEPAQAERVESKTFDSDTASTSDDDDDSSFSTTRNNFEPDTGGSDDTSSSESGTSYDVSDDPDPFGSTDWGDDDDDDDSTSSSESDTTRASEGEMIGGETTSTGF